MRHSLFKAWAGACVLTMTLVSHAQRVQSAYGYDLMANLLPVLTLPVRKPSFFFLSRPTAPYPIVTFRRCSASKTNLPRNMWCFGLSIPMPERPSTLCVNTKPPTAPKNMSSSTRITNSLPTHAKVTPESAVLVSEHTAASFSFATGTSIANLSTAFNRPSFCRRTAFLPCLHLRQL
jgi:hypothetical protein